MNKYLQLVRDITLPLSLLYGAYVAGNLYKYHEADSQLREWRAEEDAFGLPHLSLGNIQGSDRELNPEDLGRMISRLEEWEDTRNFHRAKMFNPFAHYNSIYDF